MRPFLGFLCSAVFALGCTGLSLGEKDPENNLGTYLGTGEIAVDPITESAFVLLGDDASGKSRLYAVKADGDAAREVLSLDGSSDPRLLFTAGGVMVMSERGLREELVMLDRETFEETGRHRAPTRYWGTRLSANRRWVGVADNNDSDYDIHIIDSTNWETRVIPHGGDWVEAMFGNKTDALFTISIDEDSHRAHIMSFDMNRLATNGFAFDPDTLTFKDRDLDVAVEGVMRDSFFSFSWVGVSPDDSTVVFPVRKFREGSDPYASAPLEDYRLIVLDVASGTTRTVSGAKGPVGFSPDGSTIVSYDDAGLVLIDADTLKKEQTTVPMGGGLSYFVSHQGNFVVVAANWGSTKLTLHDIDTGEQTQMTGATGSLDEFVVRDTKGIGRQVAGSPSAMLTTPVEQLWMVESVPTGGVDTIDGGVLKLADLRYGDVSVIDTPFAPEHINILRESDLLVMTDTAHTALHFFDPVQRKEVRKASLPGLGSD